MTYSRYVRNPTPADNVAREIEDLRRSLGVYDPDETAIIADALEEIEHAQGFALAEDEFLRAVDLSHRFGDPAAAFNRVHKEAQEDEAAWEHALDEGVAKIVESIGRELTPGERRKLIDAHDDHDAPDAEGKWRDLYGERYDEDAIKAVEQKFQAEHEEMHEKYSPAYIEAWRAEHEPKMKEQMESMRKSGIGDYDLEDRQGRLDYLAAAITPAEAEPVTVPPLSDDATKSERVQHMDARLNGATVDGAPEDAFGYEVETEMERLK